MEGELLKLKQEIETIKRVSPISTYKDLEVYQLSYRAMLITIKFVICNLPNFEKFDLVDQLRRSSKAVPRLISEGYAKKHQPRGFGRYLDDAAAEINETEVGLQQCIDLYSENIDIELVRWLVDIYSRLGKQVFSLKNSWVYVYKSSSPTS
ncbi:four helix bundle protein [Candidatus Falkowbacteria bacterium CG10_big_fil_rev_8_21_14_0_10_39_11]|uniref:Four helix bundle protein n=1 Tax=Candidatus Falkowbacteria bacterium CG10_big_fil_rev_8_21_14_0_10_39_11 TaxID=1974565 RepID=A0A2H0V4I2_9BACT|nr:MAG: four helix bundle protein [Candidatus Falkowbacteria bacterium CG10_big_fil_rev_8_21_14_0_10_39_11]